MIKNLVYNKYINSFLRNVLKPFSKQIPAKYKFPINGVFSVKGNNIPTFKIATNPTSYASKILFWNDIEGFEYSSVKIFSEVVKKANVFFDIGSNIGYYSLLASSIKNKNITVHAFEPMQSAYKYLEKNCNINRFNNILPQRLALSNLKGKATFFSIANEKFKNFDQLTGDGGLSQNQSGNRTKLSFDIDVTTLDEYVNKNLPNKLIDLIKLDTEANEHRVLEGASNVLKNHRPIIQCEILKNEVEKEIEAILSQYNYLYFRATNQGLLSVDNFLNNTTDYVDYYLVPKEKKQTIEHFIYSNG